jgi:hypothetical protein
MPKRLVGVLLLALLLFQAVPAYATEGAPAEGEAPPPEYSEICNPENKAVYENCPQEYEQPTVFAAILWPLLGLAGLAAIALLLMYLWWQPRFAQERDRVKGVR